jgi:hypothetical protein
MGCRAEKDLNELEKMVNNKVSLLQQHLKAKDVEFSVRMHHLLGS